MTNDGFFTGAVNRWLLSSHSLLKKRTTSTRCRPYATVVEREGEFDFVNMGKSNKFDYTNRANSGAKLGQIIGGALQKEAEKVKRDAERHLLKARKQSSDEGDGAAEINSTTHIIDLKAPGKNLGDEGVSALVDGLEGALKSGTNAASLALEDLNLSGNAITTASLAQLAPIIKLAKCDLKTLNLSCNSIKVETDVQAEQWETFLQAFQGCLKLRRLDLSNNAELGSRALEIFARVHIAERPIQPVLPGGEASVLSLVSEENVDEPSPLDQYVSALDTDSIANGFAMSDARLIKRRCGLRSIPYVTLHDIGLDDAGALWLSYVLQDHHYPNQLMDELNATNVESLIKTYQQDTNSRGIDWAENKGLGKDGVHVLEKTEAIRRQTMLEDGGALASSPTPDDDDVPFTNGEHMQGRRRSAERRVSRVAQGDRRVSIRSIRTDDGGEHEASELESARRRIQRYIIAHDGLHTIELFDSILKVFRTSRILLYLAPMSRRYHTGAPLFKVPSKVPSTAMVTVQPPTPADSPVASSPPHHLNIDPAKANKAQSTSQESYASKLIATGDGKRGSPELALTEVTNTPTSPLKFQKPTQRKGAFSEGTDLSSVSDQLNILVVRDGGPERFVKYQTDRIASAGRSFRDERVACHLPTHLIEYIVGFTMGEREMDVLSKMQMTAAIERGQDRETLMAEREWLKKDESAQVWMLLDSVRCLTYGE